MLEKDSFSFRMFANTFFRLFCLFYFFFQLKIARGMISQRFNRICGFLYLSIGIIPLFQMRKVIKVHRDVG